MSMSKRFVLCGMVLLGLLLAVGWMQLDGAKAAPKEGSPFSGTALHVSLRAQAVSVDLFLEQPEVRAIGGQHFIVGRAIGGKNKVWIPLSQVNLLEEFADTAEMGRFYKLPDGHRGEKKPQ